MLSPASGPAVLHWGNDLVNLYLVSLEIQPWWSGLLTCIVSDLVGTSKIPLYCMEYNWPTTIASTNEELAWAQCQWGKNLISLLGRGVVNFWSIVSQKRPLTPKYIHNSSALEYICSLYHKELQYIAKLRWITIDLYKSHLVTIETPRNHISLQHWIVFAIVEKYVGIVMNFLISKKRLSFQSTLKLHKNYNLNHFVPTHTSLRRLCPWPPDPNTAGKLRLSAFCMCC